MAPERALAAMVQASLAQVLPNLAALADGLTVAPEHVHQLRVGLRRLRVALREFGAGVTAVDPAWDEVLANTFRTLGRWRDDDVLQETLLPARLAAQRAGLLPTIARSQSAAHPGLDRAAVLREHRLHQLLLALIGLSMAGVAKQDGPALGDVARQRLTRLRKRVAADAAAFAALDDDARHRLRKRLKRLRYSLDFVASLFSAKDVAAYLAVLKPAQDALGQCNDEALAQAACRAAGTPTPADAFVLGWLSARRDTLAADAASRLELLAAAPRFWKR